MDVININFETVYLINYPVSIARYHMPVLPFWYIGTVINRITVWKTLERVDISNKIV